MGFLHKLWDETLAGPAPETGLGKLRKCNSLSVAAATAASRASPPADEILITRSITIIKTNNNLNLKNLSVDPGSAPDSPASSACTPRTPFTPGTPRGEFKKWTRRKTPADAFEHTDDPTRL
ncbi:dormancy-associated protein homolog 4 isoform X2 [Mercurialis annua]|uniref:dormancy-associated protein homolog 4 isoform X2 n=1 Tax=Mercurialis annua TaxID=3986 RepID=UPI00215E3DB0|nr:dormancy-associated protein homolog 4 isoform X2 [Mercurialis annua]